MRSKGWSRPGLSYALCGGWRESSHHRRSVGDTLRSDGQSTDARPALAYPFPLETLASTGDRATGSMAPKRIWSPSKTRAFVPTFPLPDLDHRTEFFSARGASAMTPSVMSTSVRQAKNCALIDLHSTERSLRYRARARDCNHCPLKAQCTTSTQGRSLCRSVDEEVSGSGACLSADRSLQESLAQTAGLGRTAYLPRAKTGMACDAFACDGSGASTVRRSCEQQDKISSACSKNEDGDGVHAQQRPCVPSFWFFGGGDSSFFGVSVFFLID